MFLNNEDYFLICRLILTDLLDNYNALKLTNKIIVEAKRALTRLVAPELALSKKRKISKITKKDDDYVHKLIDEFEHEETFSKYYVKVESGGEGGQVILLDQFEELEDRSLYLFLDAKEINTVLDLKREVVMTMLNSLEKLPIGKKFFYFQGVLPSSVGIRFHKSKPAEMAEKIAMGRLGKFMNENTLLNQEFIKDSKLNVSQYMKSVDKDLTATGFIRFALG